MKNFFALAIIFFITATAAQAAAINVNSTWAQIRNSMNTHVEMKTVTFKDKEFNTGLVYQSVFDTCYIPSTDQIRTKNKVTLVRLVNAGSSQSCTQTRSEYRYYPLSYNIKVFQKTPGASTPIGNLMFTKSFSIPACY